ncbi:hypothetical protein GCM10025858_00230 [Alicyclobacillus sacchari]|nr:hypothetical protein GCM10025858_00230 [Alicyclobacillus sacchari]
MRETDQHVDLRNGVGPLLNPCTSGEDAIAKRPKQPFLEGNCPLLCRDDFRLALLECRKTKRSAAANVCRRSYSAGTLAKFAFDTSM